MIFSITEIELVNFKSFIGEHIIELAPRGPGLHCLRGVNKREPALGSNGAGKSTALAHALAWCLYGQTQAGLHNPDVKPWYDSGTTSVSVFITKGKAEHEVKRSIGPNSLTLDGEAIGQADLEHWFGLSLTAFSNTILIGQGQPLFFDIPPRDKMEMFSDVMQLERWEQRAAAAGEYAGKLRREADRAIGRVSGLETQASELDKLLASAKEQAAEWDEKQAKVLKTSEADVAQKQKELDALINRRTKADLALEAAVIESRSIKNESAKLIESINEVAREINVHERELTARESMKQSGKCPTCGQVLRHPGKSDPKLEANLRKQITTLRDLMTKDTKAHSVLCRAFDKFDRQEKKARDELDTLVPLSAKLEAELGVLKQTLDDREDQLNPFGDQVRKLQRRKKALALEIEDDKLRIGKLERNEARARFWSKGFRELRLNIIDSVLKELDVCTNVMLAEVGLAGWSIAYATEKENKSGTVKRAINVEVSSPYNSSAVKWESFSGGEAQRLRVVGAMALADVLLRHAGLEFDLQIFDEPTSHISSEGIRDLVDFLSERARRLKRQIWIADQHAMELGAFGSVLTIVKDDEGSSIKEE